MTKRSILLILIAFCTSIHSYSVVSKDLAKAEETLAPYLDALDNIVLDSVLTLNCEVQNYDFMDSICSRIYETASLGKILPFTLENVKSGVLHIQIWEYDKRRRCFDVPYWGDLYKEFSRNGTYVLEIEYNYNKDIYDVFNFSYCGLSFASEIYLYPFYKNVAGLSIQLRPILYRVLLYPLIPEILDTTFKGYFLVINGRLVASEMKKSTWNGIYGDRDALDEFISNLDIDDKNLSFD